MKHYLDLVPISARVHKKQNRMSVFCIALAVFLVTTIFGMADMFVRSQILKDQQDYGNWHILLHDITAEDAAVIAARPDVEVFTQYDTVNYSAAQGYLVGGRETVICGSGEDWFREIFPEVLADGSAPKLSGEAVITDNAENLLGLTLGDSFELSMPDGAKRSFTVSGFIKTAALISRNDCFGIFVTLDDFRTLAVPGSNQQGEAAGVAAPYYLRFAGTGNVRAKIAALKSQCGIEDWQVQENTMLLGLLGQSRSSFMMRIYVAAAVLSVLVLCAGSLMIASSLNSNVAQRTEFFGLLRCVGATPRQVMRLVRKEALNWCRFAIPAGVLCGVAVIWILCAVLRALSPEYFGAIPVLSFSAASVLAGLVIGLLTVLLAVRAPAKRAARVSPLAAVSGSANDLQPVRRAANTKLFKVDAALGIHHARESRKNFALMTGSFALSIVLFLSFSVPAAFFNHALTPLYPWAADISATSADGACSIAPARVNELAENPAVEAVYGRMCAYNVPVTIGEERKTALLVSYDARQFAWAEDYLQSGSVKDAENKENTALAIYSAQSPMQPGDRLSVEYGGQSTELTLGGILTASPAKANTGEEVIICAEETFRRITGESGYAVFDMRLANGATDAEVNEIRRSLGEGLSFSDKRADNESIMGAYYSVWLFIYGFLVLIALITVFNVINSVAMSVAARTKQYGVFRAIGLSDTQLSRMIVAEATAYAVTGSVLGTALGLGLNKLLFDIMISARWGDTWSVPVSGLIFILLLVAASVALAVYAPIKRIQKMSIVENIGAQ